MVTLSFCLVYKKIPHPPFKITKRTMRADMSYIRCWSSVKSLIQESRECAHLESSLGSNS